jgi:hypothetical protein
MSEKRLFIYRNEAGSEGKVRCRRSRPPRPPYTPCSPRNRPLTPDHAGFDGR